MKISIIRKKIDQKRNKIKFRKYINIYINNLKGDKKQINEFFNKLIEQM